ncbi:hypothetical protein CLAIMM_05998 [Cladophialophora immunda]|nr:hypothetical protein CLAIMM_05998 [Cladophialophora immunda]
MGLVVADLLAPATIIYLVLAYIAYEITRSIRSPLRDVPGPWSARFTRLWLLRQVYNGQMHQTGIDLHRQLGPIVRLAPNEYSIDDPDSVQLIYGSKGKFCKGPWYEASTPPGTLHTSIFSDPNIERQALHRRRIAHAYSMTTLVQLEPFINDCTSLLRLRLDELAATGMLVDIPHWTQSYAFDVIGAITFGVRFGFLDKGEDIGGIMSALHSTLIYAARAGVYAEWSTVLFYLNAIVSARSMKGMAHTLSYMQKQIDARLDDKSPKAEVTDDDTPVDFITRFLLLRSESPERVDRQAIETSALNNLFAGSDTTSISLCSVIYHVYQNSRVLSRLRGELDNAVKSGAVGEPITYKQAQSLPYLQAVIKESLRCHPAGGLAMGRVVPAGGAVIAGRVFPAGVSLLWSVIVLQLT